MAPKVLGARGRAERHLSGQALRAAALLPVRLLDRRRPRRQSLRHHRGHARGPCGRTRLLRSGTIRPRSGSLPALSITERQVRVPRELPRRARSRACGSGEAEAIKARNPGEAYRQYLTCVLRKLDATIARAEGGTATAGAAYANADELILDLRVLETALRRPGSRRSPQTWCGRCATRCRSSASPPCASTFARTPPAPPTPCRLCGARRRRPAASLRLPSLRSGRLWLLAELARPRDPDRAPIRRCRRRRRDARHAAARSPRCEGELDREAFG